MSAENRPSRPGTLNVAVSDPARWPVKCFYFYLLDPEFGRCWVRVRTHLPSGVAVSFNGHQWLARRLQQLPLRFERRDNCFMNAEDWGKLQQEADRLDASAMCRLSDRWVYRLAPFFRSNQRQAAGLYYQHFFSQVQYCHNLIFKRSAALSYLFDRIIDRSRNVGRPDLLATYFGEKTYCSQRGKLQTKIIDRDNAHPVIETRYKKGWIKQYK